MWPSGRLFSAVEMSRKVTPLPQAGEGPNRASGLCVRIGPQDCASGSDLRIVRQDRTSGSCVRIGPQRCARRDGSRGWLVRARTTPHPTTDIERTWVQGAAGRAQAREKVSTCVKGQGSKVKGQGSRVKGQGSRVKGQGSRVKSQESRVKGQEPRARPRPGPKVSIGAQSL
jgi:hypothetical protein